MAYTLDDFVKLNPGYSKRYDPTSKTAYVKNNTTGKEVGFLSGQGQEYGLGGIQNAPGQVNGSNIVSDPNKLISSLGTTEYKSPYSDEIKNTLGTLSNRKFSYDPNSDVGLKSAQDNAIDITSRAAARKGMIYSDSNKASMGKAALDLVPQFEQSAFSKYQAENADLYNKLGSLSTLENNEFNKFNTDRTFAAGRSDANQGQLNWDKSFNTGNDQWAKSFGENKRQFDVGQKNWQQEMTFKERQAQIDNAVSSGQLSISQSQLLLSKAKWDAENDPNSLDNQIRRAQLSGINASTSQTEEETKNIQNGLTPSGGLPSGTQPSESEVKRAEEVKLQSKLDSFIAQDGKGSQKPDLKAQQDWIKANKSNIIGTFGRDYYNGLAADYYIIN
jgi:hypothetical protein